MDKSKNPKKEKVKPGTQPKRGPKGSQSADMDWLSDRMEKKKQIGDNTQMNYSNAYVKRLMEMDGPTDKDLDDIKKEKPAKIPKKKYFGGKTDPKKVDTKAAIASHKKGIRAAGEKSKLAEITSIPRNISSGDRYPSHIKSSPVLRGEFAKKLKGTTNPDEKRNQRKAMAKRTGQERGPAATDKTGTRASKKTQAATKRALKDWSEYQRLGALFVEAAFPKGPTAKRYGALGRAKEGASKIKDPLVKREVAKTKANVDKKTKSKTNPKVSDLVQGSMNRRRGESRRKGTGGLPPLDKQTSTADAKRDRYRRMAPGDK